MERNTLYICTEINAREYDEYFLLSIDLLNNTSIDSVVIANQQILKFLLSNLPLNPGFVLVKSAQKNQMKNFSDISARGHHIICQNAEFCVTWPDEGENDLKMISPDTLKFVKCILTHNSLETKLINEFTKLYHLSIDTLELGNIRFLRGANEYNKYYGDYIKKKILKNNPKFVLFVSSLGPSNLYKGLTRKEIYNFLIKSDSTEPSHAERLSYQYFYHQYLFKEFAECIKSINNNLNDKINFIIRPHPSDDIEQLKKIFLDIPNIEIIEENSYKPWALASKLVISSSSSTLVEASCLEKKSISFLPVWPDDQIGLVDYFKKHEVNKSSQQVYSNEILSNSIKMIHEGIEKIELDDINKAKHFLGVKEDKMLGEFYTYIEKNLRNTYTLKNNLFIPLFFLKPIIKITILLTEIYKFIFYKKGYRAYLKQKNIGFTDDCLKLGAKNHIKNHKNIVSNINKKYTFLKIK